MNRLTLLNFVGVLALAALCVAQWERDRRLNLEVNRLESTRIEQASKMGALEKSAELQKEDLAVLKEQIAKGSAELASSLAKLREAEHFTQQLKAERDQLKTSVTNWAAASSARDEQIKELMEQNGILADRLNASIHRFNELASNHNAIVIELDALRAVPSQGEQGKRE